MVPKDIGTDLLADLLHSDSSRLPPLMYRKHMQVEECRTSRQLPRADSTMAVIGGFATPYFSKVLRGDDSDSQGAIQSLKLIRLRWLNRVDYDVDFP
jgi:hypothetical protein